MTRLIVPLSILVLGGCAAIPDRVALEVDHTSHISQHFGEDSTNYGFDSGMLTARWEGKRAYLELGEGAAIDSCSSIPYYNSPRVIDHCGAFMGPRELFTARVGLVLWEKGR